MDVSIQKFPTSGNRRSYKIPATSWKIKTKNDRKIRLYHSTQRRKVWKCGCSETSESRNTCTKYLINCYFRAPLFQRYGNLCWCSCQFSPILIKITKLESSDKALGPKPTAGCSTIRVVLTAKGKKLSFFCSHWHMSSSLSLEHQKGLFSKSWHETLLCNSALHRPAAFEGLCGCETAWLPVKHFSDQAGFSIKPLHLLCLLQFSQKGTPGGEGGEFCPLLCWHT